MLKNKIEEKNTIEFHKTTLSFWKIHLNKTNRISLKRRYQTNSFRIYRAKNKPTLLWPFAKYHFQLEYTELNQTCKENGRKTAGIQNELKPVMFYKRRYSIYRKTILTVI